MKKLTFLALFAFVLALAPLGIPVSNAATGPVFSFSPTGGTFTSGGTIEVRISNQSGSSITVGGATLVATVSPTSNVSAITIDTGDAELDDWTFLAGTTKYTASTGALSID